MANYQFYKTPKIYIFFLTLVTLFSCRQPTVLTVAQASSVKDNVQQLLSHTQHDLAVKGPIAWLNYFENSPCFYMASDGKMAFKSYRNADGFIKDTLAHTLRSIELKLTNVRIDLVNTEFATIGADFHENLVITLDKVLPFDGYLTATAHRTTNGWKYRNLHWSIIKRVTK